jgi:hypothetical protein
VKKPIVTFSRNDPESELVFAHYMSIKLGEMAKEIDGFYYFFPEPNSGNFPSNILRGIADELDRLNKSWADQVNAQLTITE